jgi:hypothetical protein
MSPLTCIDCYPSEAHVYGRYLPIVAAVEYIDQLPSAPAMQGLSILARRQTALISILATLLSDGVYDVHYKGEDVINDDTSIEWCTFSRTQASLVLVR